MLAKSNDPTRRSFRLLTPQRWYRLLLFFAHKYRVHGISATVFMVDRAPGEVLRAKLEEALRLLRDIDPRRFTRLQRHVSLIWMRPLPRCAAAIWVKNIGVCIVRDGFVLDEATRPVHLASVLVHETTHAWLDAIGIRTHDDPAYRVRVERICVRAEIAFARRAGEMELVEEHLEALRAGDLVITPEKWNHGMADLIVDVGGSSRFARALARLARWRLLRSG